MNRTFVKSKNEIFRVTIHAPGSEIKYTIGLKNVEKVIINGRYVVIIKDNGTTHAYYNFAFDVTRDKIDKIKRAKTIF